jgi:hypothetical protein
LTVPHQTAGTSVLAPAHIDSLPGVHIIRNPALETMMFDRNIIGAEFASLCHASVRAFVAHMADELTAGTIAELIVLSKGYAYDMRRAALDELSIELPVNMIATQRSAVEGSDADITVSYASLDAPADTLVIGDTIASGATICAALERYLQDYPLKRVIVFSIAGATIGVRRIIDFCADCDIEPTIVLGLASFGLADNGFDLSFLNSGTVCDKDLRQRARAAFHGQPVSSVGWDFGSQLMAPAKYRALCWVESCYWGLEDTDVFRLAQQPTDRRQIEREYAAYQDRLPDIDALLAPADAQPPS